MTRTECSSERARKAFPAGDEKNAPKAGPDVCDASKYEENPKALHPVEPVSCDAVLFANGEVALLLHDPEGIARSATLEVRRDGMLVARDQGGDRSLAGLPRDVESRIRQNGTALVKRTGDPSVSLAHHRDRTRESRPAR